MSNDTQTNTSEQRPAVATRLDRGVRALDPERVDFEAWLQKEHGLSGTWNDARNCFDEFPCHLAFKAWKAARPKRDKVGVIYNVASALAQRKPLEALAPLTESTHIGHRQMARAYRRADEDTRLLAVKLADAVRAL